ncbi:hypothetical protein B0J15DRAFT_559686 [Fusarium solani]|uniref:Histidine decarboxylase n=1 Tax=Fusarium solani TaxID=169388 RepID=A0A9P9H7Y0_FUSSL|nr:uncharacterized protein B0J15DRAFT_559686 [Fusarium solani]KAH7252874.1 hypothetical protein B0J15DRAFT_559686 [Fusarium solani]
MANLLGIVLARDHCLPQGKQHLGVAYMSDQTHYSAVKALRLLGFGKDQILRVRADKSFRLDRTARANEIQHDRRAGSRYEAAKELKFADSLSWNSYKWKFQTHSSGILIVMDRTSLVKSFVNEGDFLRDAVALQDEEISNFWNYSMEITRPSSRR